MNSRRGNTNSCGVYNANVNRNMFEHMIEFSYFDFIILIISYP